MSRVDTRGKVRRVFRGDRRGCHDRCNPLDVSLHATVSGGDMVVGRSVSSGRARVFSVRLSERDIPVNDVKESMVNG